MTSVDTTTGGSKPKAERTLRAKTLFWVLGYGLVIALAGLGLELLEFQVSARRFPYQGFLFLIAAGFLGLGVWMGLQLRQRTDQLWEPNDKALRSLGITEREHEVLRWLATGMTNKDLAKQLSVSPHTIKTHLGHLYDKLEVTTRTEAVHEARNLRLIP